MKQHWLFCKRTGALMSALLLTGGLTAQTGGDCLPLTNPDCTAQVPLLAAQDMEVGTVIVQSDETEVCVTYFLNEDYVDMGLGLYEAHLFIGSSVDDIPQTKGNRWGTNPIPGLFPYQEYLDGVPCVSFCVSFDDLGLTTDDTLVIAAHAVVGQYVDDVLMTETAWGEGDRFNQRGNWGMYFSYEPCDSGIVTSYIGYEDRASGFDFDYNDFGMDLTVVETYDDDVLTQIDMTFIARVNLADAFSDIHIKRILEGDWTYTLTRPDHTAAGTEALPATDVAGSGDFDVILFDTENWPNDPGQMMGQTVEITINLLTNDNTVSDINPAPRWDLDNDFSMYDPYLYNRTQDNTVNITHWLTPTSSAGDLSDLPKDYEVPSILVVPEENWDHPGEGVPIVTPYPDFDDYYRTMSPTYADWYQ